MPRPIDNFSCVILTDSAALVSVGLGRLRRDDPAFARHPLPPVALEQGQVRGHRQGGQEGLSEQQVE